MLFRASSGSIENLQGREEAEPDCGASRAFVALWPSVPLEGLAQVTRFHGVGHTQGTSPIRRSPTGRPPAQGSIGDHRQSKRLCDRKYVPLGATVSRVVTDHDSIE